VQNPKHYAFEHPWQMACMQREYFEVRSLLHDLLSQNVNSAFIITVPSQIPDSIFLSKNSGRFVRILQLAKFSFAHTIHIYLETIV